MTQKKVPSASTRSRRRSSGLIEDLLHQDRNHLMEGFSPWSAGSVGASGPSRMLDLNSHAWISLFNAHCFLVIWSFRGFLEDLCKLLPNAPFPTSRTEVYSSKCLNCLSSVQFSSVTQSCLTLCNPMDCSTPGFPVHHQLLELAQTHVHQAVMPSNHFILCCPLLLLSSIFPSIRDFSNKSVLRIR